VQKQWPGAHLDDSCVLGSCEVEEAGLGLA